jgi:aspartyl-tRNA(Asn)/glutamyl-tRNA(Gln) amidotransferase subunit A
VDTVAYVSALELRRLYREHELSPVEVFHATARQIDAVNPTLNALVTPTLELALAQAEEAERAYASGHDVESRPLLGLPITFKDTIPTKGIRTTGGSLLAKDTVPTVDAPVVARAMRSGAMMLGKTNTPEYGWKGETTSPVFGTTRNPWNPERTPGGSSGGAAVCVACGIGPFAVGGDGAGSIRIPAAFTGVFGFKCTFGLIPVGDGSIESLSCVGLASWHVRDAALLLASLAGAHPSDRLSLPRRPVDWVAECDGNLTGLRVAWSPDLGFAPVEDEIAELARDAAFTLANAGADVQEVELDFDDPHDICYALFAAGSAGDHRENWEAVAALVDEGRKEMVEVGFAMSGADVGAALNARAEWVAKMNGVMESYDLVLTPTVPLTAFPAGIHHPESVNGVPTPRFTWTPFTYGMNLTGQPAASVPCGFAGDGLPVGLQIIGRRHEDTIVFRAAAAFEALRSWHDARPPIATAEHTRSTSIAALEAATHMPAE